jgi:hypothetical protein
MLKTYKKTEKSQAKFKIADKFGLEMMSLLGDGYAFTAG